MGRGLFGFLTSLWITELVLISTYAHDELLLGSVGSLTVSTNIMFLVSVTVPWLFYICYTEQSFRSIGNCGLFLWVLCGLIPASGCLVGCVIAYCWRGYANYSPLYTPILILIHLCYLPIIKIVLIYLYRTLKFTWRILQRLYKQEEIRQKRAEMELKMVKKFEAQDQFRDVIAQARQEQQEVDYQSYLEVKKLNAETLLAEKRINLRVIENLNASAIDIEASRLEGDSYIRQGQPDANQTITIYIEPVKSPNVKGDPENCPICYEKPIDHVIVPCGHFVCEVCQNRLEDYCPLCRQPYSQIIKAYLVRKLND